MDIDDLSLPEDLEVIDFAGQLDEPPALGGRGVDRAPAHDQIACPPAADEPRQQGGFDDRWDADPHLRHREAGILGGQAQIAARGDLQPAPHPGTEGCGLRFRLREKTRCKEQRSPRRLDLAQPMTLRNLLDPHFRERVA